MSHSAVIKSTREDPCEDICPFNIVVWFASHSVGLLIEQIFVCSHHWFYMRDVVRRHEKLFSLHVIARGICFLLDVAFYAGECNCCSCHSLTQLLLFVLSIVG